MRQLTLPSKQHRRKHALNTVSSQKNPIQDDQTYVIVDHALGWERM